MKIESYAYGQMAINGKIYRKDLIIFPDRITPNWRRNEGHSLNLDDLEDVIKVNPELIIIGKGSSGFMNVPLTVNPAPRAKARGFGKRFLNIALHPRSKERGLTEGGVKLALKEKGIEVIDKNTAIAIEIFNEQSQMGKKVVGAFHLTC